MPADQDLAELLRQLKERSGRSYTALASRTGLSRSSLHRYCLGTTVPGSFGTVERVARACGAGQEDLDRLYRAWARADAKRALQSDASAAAAPDHVPATRTVSDPPTPEPSREDHTAWPLAPSTRTRLLLLVVALVAVASLVVADSLLTGDPAGSGAGDGTQAQQQIIGPHWSMAPQAIPPEFFGVTMNTDTGAMPGFRVGAVRLWDGETRWGQVEPEPGTYDWSVMERMVRGAEQAGLDVEFTFGGTPGWASPHGVPSVYGDGTRTSPPDDLDDWDRFVRKVAARYRGRIDSYELWDNAGTRTHYAGTVSTLAEMVRRAARIIRRTDPNAVLACPSFSRLWEHEGQQFLREFARTGAYEHCDAAAAKLHPRHADGPPEEIIELAARVARILYEEDTGLPLWNTGPGKDIATTAPLSAWRARAYAVRFYLAGLYSRKSKVERMYFYSWGSTGVPLVIQPVGGAPTEAGRRIERLQQWLKGARITSCGRRTQEGLPTHLYQCRFTRTPARSPHREWFLIRWTVRGHTDIALGEGAYRVRTMDGSEHAVHPGERLRVGEQPVMIEHRTT